MAASGDLFGESPGACPFVALEQDRDRRSDQPDYRHRCYAEPTPAPRAMAHQEAFCLSPNFSACPVFQDWAVRAAARPVPVPTGYQGRDTAALAAADEALDADEVGDAQVADASPDATRDSQERLTDEAIAAAAAAAAGVAAADALAADEPLVTRNEQLGAFDESAEPDIPPPYASFEPDEQLPPEPAQMTEPAPLIGDEDDIPPVPPFLADRPFVAPAAAAAATSSGPVEPPAAPPRSSIGSVPSADKVRREDVVPSWEIDNRFGAQPGDEPPDDRFGGWLTALAVIAILALGVAGVIFLPGLLAGAPARTAGPSQSIGPSASVPFQTSTPLPSFTVAPATPTATPGEPTAEPSPAATPKLYRIKSGDTLAKIARRNGITVADILAANPEISDPNQIQVGRIIIIPLPLPTAAP